MIQYMRDGKVMDLLRPVAGRWTATVKGREVCEVEVEVEDGMVEAWERKCALDVAHLLPDGLDHVVREWLETGDRALKWDAYLAATRRANWPKGAKGYALRAAAFSAHDAYRAVWAAERAVYFDSGPYACAEAKMGWTRHLHGLIWTAHGEKLTTRERIELSRDLRYHGEEEAAAAVLPIELREVAS